MSEIKMRINNNSDSVCNNCGTKYKFTQEMYDIMLFGEVHHVCYGCIDKLFHKTLTAQIKYQSKIKTKEDMARINRSKALRDEEEDDEN